MPDYKEMFRTYLMGLRECVVRIDEEILALPKWRFLRRNSLTAMRTALDEAARQGQAVWVASHIMELNRERQGEYEGTEE